MNFTQLGKYTPTIVIGSTARMSKLVSGISDFKRERISDGEFYHLRFGGEWHPHFLQRFFGQGSSNDPTLS